MIVVVLASRKKVNSWLWSEKSEKRNVIKERDERGERERQRERD